MLNKFWLKKPSPLFCEACRNTSTSHTLIPTGPKKNSEYMDYKQDKGIGCAFYTPTLQIAEKYRMDIITSVFTDEPTAIL